MVTMPSKGQIIIEIVLLFAAIFALGWQACEIFGGGQYETSIDSKPTVGQASESVQQRAERWLKEAD